MSVSNSTRQRSAQSPHYEEVVISGLAGCYPESENVYQLQDNLFNKVDMVTEDDRRWKFGQ
jgi:fatty acid synthase